MADASFLVVRLGSLGDVVHTLPAVAALREAFPCARIDWVIEEKWAPLLQGSPDVNEVVQLDRTSFATIRGCLRRLRAAANDCVLDFQGLYKSAVLARLSRAPKRVGWDRRFAREGGSALFYTHHVAPKAAHVVDQNLELVASVGARIEAVRFPLVVSSEIENQIARLLLSQGVGEYFVLSPGGGWRSKCWPPELYGELCRRLTERTGWRGVINYGPGESELAEAVRQSAAKSDPVCCSVPLDQFMALLRRAKLVVAGDSGPLHLAVALGTPVVGLYGPTDPARNGPYSKVDVVVRNAAAEETTYRRGDEYSPAMLSITVEQALAACERRLRLDK
jgi:lipopolysaccharide heptosyltransferase I